MEHTTAYQHNPPSLSSTTTTIAIVYSTYSNPTQLDLGSRPSTPRPPWASSYKLQQQQPTQQKVYTCIPTHHPSLVVPYVLFHPDRRYPIPSLVTRSQYAVRDLGTHNRICNLDSGPPPAVRVSDPKSKSRFQFKQALISLHHGSTPNQARLSCRPG